MSELIDNAKKRKELLKHMILQLHEGTAPDQVRDQLKKMLGKVPYDEIVEVEQELISEGLPTEEILDLCDIHTAALEGTIDDTGAKEAPPGHPIHTFEKENRAVEWEIKTLNDLFQRARDLDDTTEARELLQDIRGHINALADIDKHYRRKEELLFPYLEKHGIDGPPKVMWGKHDEIRELMKSAIEAANVSGEVTGADLKATIRFVLKPFTESAGEMIFKEENILFPMSLDTLTDSEWFGIYKHSIEFGFCLYDPVDEWQPEGVQTDAEHVTEGTIDDRIQLPSGSMLPEELKLILNTIPFDLTFVDKDDTVRYFTQGRERIFARTRAIIGRKVQLCHPPKSVHIVEQILEDFKAGKETRAPFWITMKGRFIHIEYFALRNEDEEYLGCLEVSQDLTEKREIKGEQRLLSYG